MVLVAASWYKERSVVLVAVCVSASTAELVVPSVVPTLFMRDTSKTGPRQSQGRPKAGPRQRVLEQSCQQMNTGHVETRYCECGPVWIFMG